MPELPRRCIFSETELPVTDVLGNLASGVLNSRQPASVVAPSRKPANRRRGVRAAAPAVARTQENRQGKGAWRFGPLGLISAPCPRARINRNTATTDITTATTRGTARATATPTAPWTPP